MAAAVLLAALMWIRSASGLVGSGGIPPGRVYTVGSLRAGLQEHPAAALGHPVRVRGVAAPCLGWASGACLTASPILADPGSDAGLALGSQTENALLTFARTLPLVGQLTPQGQPIRWGMLATYRVEIRAVPAASCTYWPCYKAVLLDAAP